MPQEVNLRTFLTVNLRAISISVVRKARNLLTVDFLGWSRGQRASRSEAIPRRFSGRELCHEDEYEYEDDHTKRSVMKVLMSAWFAE